jgi:hypothetical protein
MLRIFTLSILLFFNQKLIYSQIILDWVNTYGGKGADLFYSIIETKNNNFIAVGRFFSEINNSNNYIVIKFSSNGDEIWQRISNSNINESARAIIETNEGNYIIAGTSGNSAYYFKMNASGDIIWLNKISLNTYSYPEIRAIDKIGDSNFVMVGNSNIIKNYNILVIMIDNNGNLLWSNEYSPGVADAVAVTKNNDILVVCANKLLRLNVKGDLIGEKTITGNYSYQFYSIKKTADCGFILAGFAEGSGYKDACFLKIDDEGNKIWEKVLGTGWEEVAIGSDEMKDSGVFVIAKAPDEDGGPYKTWLLMTDSLGNILWTRKYDVSYHNNSNWPQSFLISNENEIYIVGYIENRNSTYTGYVSKFSFQMNYINNHNFKHNNDFNVLQNFPNPFNSLTKIQFYLYKKNTVKLIIYDLRGKLIKLFAFNNADIGKHEIELNDESLQSGIYLCKLIVDQNIITHKILLIK